MPTPNLGLPQLAADQAQKHVTVNEALNDLDALVQLSVLDRHLAAPPGAPAAGARYIVAAGPTGAWASHANHVAIWLDGAWRFFVPGVGWVVYVVDEQRLLAWTGSAWADALAAVQNVPMLGILTAPDSTNRLAVKSNAVLLSHDDVTPGSGNMQAVLNKAASVKDAGFVFQVNWSARALFGLLGDDDFTIKVSPDGSTFKTAIVVDRSTGKVAFPSRASFLGHLNYDHYAAASPAGGPYTFVNTDINTEDYDVGNNFAGGVFTAPRSGWYRLGYNLGWTMNGSNVPTGVLSQLIKNGSAVILPASARQNQASDSTRIATSVEARVQLAAGDTVRLQHAFYSVDGYAAANITQFWGDEF